MIASAYSYLGSYAGAYSELVANDERVVGSHERGAAVEVPEARPPSVADAEAAGAGGGDDVYLWVELTEGVAESAGPHYHTAVPRGDDAAGVAASRHLVEESAVADAVSAYDARVYRRG